MKKILFVCHGNICRSPMAEFLFKYRIKELNLENDYYCESCATSSEELNNPIHYGTKEILNHFNIDYSTKRARQITKEDYNKFDVIYCMDYYNIKNLLYFFKEDKENKIKLLLETKDVKDPWYSGNFIETYIDITKGIDKILNIEGENRKWKTIV